MIRVKFRILLTGCVVLAAASLTQAGEALVHEPIRPLQALHVDADKSALGERLFNEPRLSGDNSISCAHCHHLDAGGTDNLKHSFGVNGVEGDINSPTVFNAALNTAQFWDGRAKSLQDQIDGPLHARAEMASNWPDVINKLSADKTYRTVFAKLYDDELSATTIKHAIAEFQRSLIVTDSRFDQFLRGDEAAINAEEKKGYALFKDFGCVACHQGENVGGNMFQVFGVMEDYFAKRGDIDEHDLGRFNVTGKASDKFKFKVPSLRLVTLTAPYFHDGSAKTLEDAIRAMGRFQLALEISDADIASIIAFLRTLTGKHAQLNGAE